MHGKPIKIPGPDHPITITSARERITVTVAGRRIVDTREALILKEATYSPVYYIPREHVDMTQLQRTSDQTYCPYKGECAYYSRPNCRGQTNRSKETDTAIWNYHSCSVSITISAMCVTPRQRSI
jgi:uncharacterized protein (DUF427 family)